MKDKVINRCVRESTDAGVAVVRHGLLVHLRHAVNRAIRGPDGETNYCLFASAVLQDVLKALGLEASVMRVETSLSPDTDHKASVGLGRHVIAIADGQYLLDATLDQANEEDGMAFQPLVAVAPRWWFKGGRPIFIPTDGGVVRYVAVPKRSEFKYAPDFRPSRRRAMVRQLLHLLLCERCHAEVIGAMAGVRAENPSRFAFTCRDSNAKRAGAGLIHR